MPLQTVDPKETLDVVIVARISPTVKRDVDEICKRERRRQADWLRLAIEDAVAAYKAKETPMPMQKNEVAPAL